MRLRPALLALVLAAALTACGGDDTKSTSNEPVSSGAPSSASAPSLDPSDIDTAKCAAFLKGQAEATKLTGMLNPGGGDQTDAIEAANAQFQALKDGAPENVQRAIDGVTAAYTELGNFYKDPSAMTEAGAAKIQEALQGLQENALTLNTWIAENCT